MRTYQHSCTLKHTTQQTCAWLWLLYYYDWGVIQWLCCDWLLWVCYVVFNLWSVMTLNVWSMWIDNTTLCFTYRQHHEHTVNMTQWCLMSCGCHIFGANLIMWCCSSCWTPCWILQGTELWLDMYITWFQNDSNMYGGYSVLLHKCITHIYIICGIVWLYAFWLSLCVDNWHCVVSICLELCQTTCCRDNIMFAWHQPHWTTYMLSALNTHVSLMCCVVWSWHVCVVLFVCVVVTVCVIRECDHRCVHTLCCGYDVATRVLITTHLLQHLMCLNYMFQVVCIVNYIDVSVDCCAVLSGFEQHLVLACNILIMRRWSWHTYIHCVRLHVLNCWLLHAHVCVCQCVLCAWLCD